LVRKSGWKIGKSDANVKPRRWWGDRRSQEKQKLEGEDPPFENERLGTRLMTRPGINLAREFGCGGADGGSYYEPFRGAGYAAEWGTPVDGVKGISQFPAQCGGFGLLIF
jgi:hypothetical protein